MHPKYRNCTIAPQQDFGVGELPGAGASVSVAAVVVLYYPNKVQVTRLIDSVASQVERIYAVDNTPSWDSNMPDTLARIPTRSIIGRMDLTPGLQVRRMPESAAPCRR